MQQRQLRLGDILDDYCTRERRVTNHAVVAMVGEDVKQTRCTTCDAEHEYKHAKVPRQRRKSEGQAALYSQVAAGAPKRVAHEPAHDTHATHEAEIAETDANGDEAPAEERIQAMADTPEHSANGEPSGAEEHDEDAEENFNIEEGPAHRRLIRATLPRPEGTPPPTRPAPEFTIRQPNSRQNRFRPRHQQQQQQRGASPFQGGGGNRSGNFGGGVPRQGGGSNRPPMMSRSGKRHGGPKRSK